MYEIREGTSDFQTSEFRIQTSSEFRLETSDDTTEEIFGYFGINILDKHFPLYVYASDETCRCAPSNKVTLYNLLR